MTSERKISASRQNARRSTGPKTASGKKTSRGNAVRHGLSAAVLRTSTMGEEVEELARAIAGEDPDPDRMAYSRDIAEAQVDLMRVRDARQALEAQLTATPIDREAEVMDVSTDNAGLNRVAPPSNSTPPLLIDTLDQLRRLGRYERAACHRRRRAIRALLLHQSSFNQM